VSKWYLIPGIAIMLVVIGSIGYTMYRTFRGR